MALAGSRAWTIAAHTAAAVLLGAIEAVRIDSLAAGLVLVPLFAATGLLAGAVIAASEWLTRAWPRRWAALAIAAPTLAVTIPIAQTAFDGARAQALPLAAALPVAAPIVAWLVTAAAVWLGARLAAGDRTTRAIPILGVAGALGAVVWVARHVLGGYPDARLGAALAVIVLAGVLVRLVRRVQRARYVAAALAALAIGTASAVVAAGFAPPAELRRIAARGDHGRELLRLWRELSAWREVPPDEVTAPVRVAAAPAPAPVPVPQPPSAAPARARRDDRAASAALIERTRAMNVLVVSIDSLRYDVLAPGAPHRDDFPRIARLLDESVQFARAIAPAAGSDVSVSTLITGRHDPFQALAATLPEVLRDAGRRTASVVSAEVAQQIGEVLLDRGIEVRRRVAAAGANRFAEAPARAITSEALRAIASLTFGGARSSANAPWYAWVHYADLRDRDEPAAVSNARMLEAAAGRDGAPAVHRYRALLRQIDQELGRLLDGLAAKQLADRTIVWFVSDRGASLEADPRMPPATQGAATQGGVAYAPLVRVPLAVRIPDVAPGHRLDPVSLVDVAPTLLALAGAPGALTPLDGTDLVAAILDGAAPLRPPLDRALVVHEELQGSLVEWPHQLIVRPADDIAELYDLERDPLNLKDLSVQQPDLVRRLRARYAEAPPVRVDRSASGRAVRDQRAGRPAP